MKIHSRIYHSIRQGLGSYNECIAFGIRYVLDINHRHQTFCTVQLSPNASTLFTHPPWITHFFPLGRLAGIHSRP